MNIDRIEVTLRGQKLEVTDVEIGQPEPQAGILTSYIENFRLRDGDGNFISWEEELSDSEVETVVTAIHEAERAYEERIADEREATEDEDPTPWCLACGARTRERCKCPPIAENE